MTIRNLFPKPTSPDWHKCVLGGSIILAALIAMLVVLFVVVVATFASDAATTGKDEGLKSVIERVWCGQNGCDWTHNNG